MPTEEFDPHAHDELSVENLLRQANHNMDLYEELIEGKTKETVPSEAHLKLHLAYRQLETLEDFYGIKNGKSQETRQRWASLRHSPLASAAKKKYEAEIGIGS